MGQSGRLEIHNLWEELKIKSILILRFKALKKNEKKKPSVLKVIELEEARGKGHTLSSKTCNINTVI